MQDLCEEKIIKMLLKHQKEDKMLRYNMLIDQQTQYYKDVNFPQLTYKFNVILNENTPFSGILVNLFLILSKGVKSRIN